MNQAPVALLLAAVDALQKHREVQISTEPTGGGLGYLMAPEKLPDVGGGGVGAITSSPAAPRLGAFVNLKEAPGTVRPSGSLGAHIEDLRGLRLSEMRTP